ncbi:MULTISPECIES: hypothetical protein [unclassified Microbacterium]|uniref:hypothetical protein n=1 Tax=unclassified Microbacterium TaxID=2609290 RepID=UPI0034194DA0
MTSSGGHGADAATDSPARAGTDSPARARTDSPARAATATRTVLARWGRAIADVPRLVWIAAGVVVLGLLGVAVTGGFAQVQTAADEVGAGTEVRTSAYAIAVLDAELTDAVESEYLEADPGEMLLVLTTRMENLSDEAVGVATTADRTRAGFVNTDAPLLDLTGVTPLGVTAVWRDDGSAGQVVLQPGVPSEVTFAFTVPDDAYTDRPIALDVHDVEVRRGAVILSSRVVTWRPAEVVARIVVPATETP